MPETLKIVLFSVGAAIAYGLIHDEVTAHLCIEYFSIAHPRIIATQSPFVLALIWGVIAAWWVGLALGMALAAAARVGRRSRLALADSRPMILWLMLGTAIAAFLSGGLSAFLVATGQSTLPGGWDRIIPAQRQVVFAADLWAHLASYGFGTLGGLVIVGLTIWRRLRQPT